MNFHFWLNFGNLIKYSLNETFLFRINCVDKCSFISCDNRHLVLYVCFVTFSFTTLKHVIVAVVITEEQCNIPLIWFVKATRAALTTQEYFLWTTQTKFEWNLFVQAHSEMSYVGESLNAASEVCRLKKLNRFLFSLNWTETCSFVFPAAKWRCLLVLWADYRTLYTLKVASVELLSAPPHKPTEPLFLNEIIFECIHVLCVYLLLKYIKRKVIVMIMTV